MSNGHPTALDGNIAPGFWALLAGVGLQSLTPFQSILGLYPEYLQAVMAPLSALVIGVAVSTGPTLFGDGVQRLRMLVSLVVVAIILFVFITLSFVVTVSSPDEGTTERVVIGVLGQHPTCVPGICAPGFSAATCLEVVGINRGGSMRCWGRWPVIVAEVLIFATYIAIALFLGGIGGLLRSKNSEP